MAVTIKSPNPDDVWENWKRTAQRNQNLEKYYKIKGAVFDITSITAAEYIKAVHKEALIFFERSRDIKPTSVKPKIIKVNANKLEKVRFYQFSGVVNKENWKEKEEVPFYNTLKKEACSDCGGTGGAQCKKCNGTGYVPCPTCSKNNDKLACKTCNGTGKIEIEIEVLNEKGEKTKKKSIVSCPDCYGLKQKKCPKCGGTHRIVCSYCNGLGKNKCSKCNGYGYLYSYEIKPVPFKEEHSAEPILLSSIKISGVERDLGKEIQKAMDEVEGIVIRTPNKELNQKFIEPTLGYYSKEIGKIAKQASKEWKNAEKDKEINIRPPIYLFPLLSLDCETKKGKKFQIVCIGSEKKYKVYGKV
ncbi:MAG: hypothetical protein ACTSVU_08800 [Promethearchaeota archaeon]